MEPDQIAPYMEQSDIYSCIQFVPDASKIQLQMTFNLLFAAVIRGTSRIEIYFRNLIPNEFSILYIFGRLTDHITINCVPFHSVPCKMTSSTLKSIDSILGGGGTCFLSGIFYIDRHHTG